MSNGTDLVVVEHTQEVSLGTLQADSAGALLATATKMATALAGMVEQQGLYNKISGRKHVRVEGWTTLATMLGCTPREVANEAQPDGSYVATVELVRMRDGAVISRATSECGMDEPTWAGRARYARRSMAATRATGKACRLAFSWIMALAGYDPTPLEEMPHDERDTGGDLARHAPAPTPQPSGARLATEKQRKLIWAKAKTKGDELGLGDDDVTTGLRAILATLGFESSKDVTGASVDGILAAISKWTLADFGEQEPPETMETGDAPGPF